MHDRLFTTLRVGKRLHPELDEEFIVKADKTDLDDELPAAELRKAWREVNDKLTAAIEKLAAEEWLERHYGVAGGFCEGAASESAGGVVEPDDACGDA